MKTIFAVEKSEYSHCLMKFLNLDEDEEYRCKYYNIMKEIEEKVKSLGDEIQIVITTKNTSNQYVAPAMTEENIEKEPIRCSGNLKKPTIHM